MAETESRHREVEKMALLGHWELNLTTGRLFWSEEIYRIFMLDPAGFDATYEAFLETVHPDDREYVNDAYQRSLKEKTGYDIVHRLLLKNGSLKYVNEKCTTQYTEDGVPLRSIGTVQDVTESIIDDNAFCGIVGKHKAMRDVFETIDQLAEVDIPVLIQGESGTGKELVAKAVHDRSARAAAPFVPINCGALPETLLESELFGHVKGAFTGAIRNKKGRFELAHGGTLFLDEIADLPKSVQVKLLRVLQEGSFEPVGSETTVSVYVRIVSAANRDLKKEVALGHFRQDLYYRIKEVPVHLPPLRKRKPDIPLLLDHFIQKAVRKGYRYNGIHNKALDVLMDYTWPGNVRELQSAAHYALIKSHGAIISVDHLPLEISASDDGDALGAMPETPRRSQPDGTDALGSRVRRERPRRPLLTISDVKAALDKSRGNKLKAARILGVGRATLYRFLKGNPL